MNSNAGQEVIPASSEKAESGSAHEDQPDTEFRPDPQAGKSREFLITSLLGVAASLVAGLISNYLAAIDFSKSITPAISRIHWSIWVCLTPVIYAAGCFVNDLLSDRRRILRNVLSVPIWTQLRTFGDQRVARVSYWALAIIPITAYLIAENPFGIVSFNNFILPLSFKLAFFISWFFSVALILFVIGCPKECRFPKGVGDDRTMNLILNEVTAQKIMIEQPQEVEHPELDRSALGLRALIFMFYLLGLTVSVIVLFRGAWFVLNT